MSDVYKTNFGLLYDEDNCTEMIKAREESESLYQRFYKRIIRDYELTLVCDIFELAKKIKLDDEKTWNYIRNSDYVYGQNLAFIEDTIKYIYDGKRDLSVYNWMKLINIEDNRLPKVKKQVFYKHMPVINSQDILMLWVKREGGVEDMLNFLHIILFEPTEKYD